MKQMKSMSFFDENDLDWRAIKLKNIKDVKIFDVTQIIQTKMLEETNNLCLLKHLTSNFGIITFSDKESHDFILDFINSDFNLCRSNLMIDNQFIKIIISEWRIIRL